MKAVKFMDDATCQETIDITTCLATNINRSGPLPFSESSGKVLPGQNSLLQNEIVNIKRISDQREMVLNAKKTCLFVVNFSKNHQFKPWLSIPGEQKYLEVVHETKLLGYWLTDNMKPRIHIEYILSIVNRRIWALQKLKFAGVCDEDLKYFFIMKLRSVLETSAPVFHSMLNIENSDDLERVQKIVVSIIMGNRYTTYEAALSYLDLQTLAERRVKICLDFALKCLKNPKFSKLFVPIPPDVHNLRETRSFLEPQCTTERYRNSPLVYLIRQLNEYFEGKTKE